MRKFCVLLSVVLCVLVILSGCNKEKNEPKVINTIKGNLKTYYEMSDGTWQADGISYQYRLEISGRMHNAAKDSEFVYLSNIKDITFDQAWKAAGYSSLTSDYFSVEDAVLVEMG